MDSGGHLGSGLQDVLNSDKTQYIWLGGRVRLAKIVSGSSTSIFLPQVVTLDSSWTQFFI